MLLVISLFRREELICQKHPNQYRQYEIHNRFSADNNSRKCRTGTETGYAPAGAKQSSAHQ